MPQGLLEKAKRFDRTRPNIPGEHWLALTAGLGLWLATRRHPSIPVRIAASIAGTLLVARAGSGTDVPPLLRRLPFASRPPRRHDWIG